MSASRRAGFTLVEVVIALTLVVIIFVMFASTFQESTNAAKVLTVDGELRASAQNALEDIAMRLRSTRSSAVTLSSSMSSSATRSISFYPISGTTSTSPYYTMAGSSTSYSWTPTATTGTSSWMLSTLLLTPYDNQNVSVGIAHDVADFRVTPIGTTATQNFSSTTPLLLQLSLTVTRRKVLEPATPTASPRDISVTVTTQVRVQPG